MKLVKHKKRGGGGRPPCFITLGASNHTSAVREENDFYATEPKAAEILLEVEEFEPKVVWECAAGQGHLSKIFELAGFEVIKSDKFDRGEPLTFHHDFIEEDIDGDYEGHIVTNPPYKLALQFAKKALEIVQNGKKVCLFLKLLFLEGKERKKFFLENPPKVVYVSSSRLVCAKGGDFERYKDSAVAYAWFVWEKGYKGDTVIKWVN